MKRTLTGTSMGVSMAAQRERRGPDVAGRAVLGPTLLLPALLLFVLLAPLAGCSLDENELAIERLEIPVVGVSQRVELPDGSIDQRRNLVDGVATDSEWGDVPLQEIAVSPQQGAGGGTFTVSMKVAQDSARIYFLLQWPDSADDELGPRLVFNPDSALSGTCDPQLVGCFWSLTDEDEDRVALMFDFGDARDESGRFADLGCQVACHGNMHPTAGQVDIWHWRAARTNPLQFPLFGSQRIGFADDEYASGAGRVPDEGMSFFRDNFEMVDCGDGTSGPIPLELPLSVDADGQPSTRVNDFMRPCDYIADDTARRFDECEVKNPCRLFEQEDVEVWVESDDVSATLLRRPENAAARRSRHDVEARGRWDLGVWTLELSRLLRTGNSDDVDFEIGAGNEVVMSLAVMNNAGATHAGSPVIHLMLD